jgi:hypothetical protein
MTWILDAECHASAKHILIRRKLYFFLMCCEWLGIKQEYSIDENTGTHFVSDAVQELLQDIALIEFSSKGSTGIRSRTWSRAGTELQADFLPSISNTNKESISKNIAHYDEYDTLQENIESQFDFYIGQVIFAPKPLPRLDAKADVVYDKMVTCIILKVEELSVLKPKEPYPVVFSAEDDIVIDDSDDSADIVPLFLQLHVYDGTKRWTVPATVCRIPTSVLDEYSTRLYRVYHSSEPNKLFSNSNSILGLQQRDVWTAREFDLFLSGLSK